MVRSFVTDARGKPISGYSRVTHETAFRKRWGGWYVTGTHGEQPHSGNIFGDDLRERARKEPLVRVNLTDLSPFFDTDAYLTPHSDIVAHLVLDHQSHGHNLLTRVNYEARLGRRSDAEERLVRYLLFVDEAPLEAPVAGTSGYADWFERQGPRDSRGRSLRQFDLKTRLFKYRLSFLIHTEAFRALPADAKSRVYARLWEILSGRDASADFAAIAAEERRAIVEVLRDTQPDLPDEWKP
jgi:hypothetical protein